MEALVQVRKVRKTFTRGSARIEVLQGLDVTVGQGTDADARRVDIILR